MTGLYTFPLHHNIIRDILKYFPKKVSKEWGGIQDIACVKRLLTTLVAQILSSLFF